MTDEQDPKDPCGVHPVAINMATNELFAANGRRYPIKDVITGPDKKDGTEQTWAIVTDPKRPASRNAAPVCITNVPIFDGDMVSLNEAVDIIMQRTGMSRKRAERELLRRLRNGDLQAFRVKK